VGAIFGIGFLREILKNNYEIMRATLRAQLHNQGSTEVEALLAQFDQAGFNEKGRLLTTLNTSDTTAKQSVKKRTPLLKLYRYEIVRRPTFVKIILSWLVTLPAAGIIASIIYSLFN
jgi:PiT family inorganic phosphate transporter